MRALLAAVLRDLARRLDGDRAWHHVAVSSTAPTSVYLDGRLIEPARNRRRRQSGRRDLS
jgi:hypothetical protein